MEQFCLSGALTKELLPDDRNMKGMRNQMKLTMLGTGNAMVTECYNTCFVISDKEKHFMVDGGGGNAVLRQLKHAGFSAGDMKEIFVTHKHMDHLLGIIWMIRVLCQQAAQGHLADGVTIYAHDEVMDALRDMAGQLLWNKQKKWMDKAIRLVEVHDGEIRTILDKKVTFFDIHSTKEKQFGFCMELDNGEKLTCCGDEPAHPCERAYVENSRWLLHEAFCLYAQADVFSPYEKHHATVKDACELAETLGVANLILYHTEDGCLPERKRLYGEEGSRYFHGNLYIPDDLETITL